MTVAATPYTAFELRVFAGELTPLEVAMLHEEARVLERDDIGALVLEHNKSRHLDLGVAKSELTIARKELNAFLSSLPKVMTMGDTEHPRRLPAYTPVRVLSVQGVYAEVVAPDGWHAWVDRRTLMGLHGLG